MHVLKEMTDDAESVISTFCMVYSRNSDLQCKIFLYTSIRNKKTFFRRNGGCLSCDFVR